MTSPSPRQGSEQATTPARGRRQGSASRNAGDSFSSHVASTPALSWAQAPRPSVAERPSSRTTTGQRRGGANAHLLQGLRRFVPFKQRNILPNQGVCSPRPRSQLAKAVLQGERPAGRRLRWALSRAPQGTLGLRDTRPETWHPACLFVLPLRGPWCWAFALHVRPSGQPALAREVAARRGAPLWVLGLRASPPPGPSCHCRWKSFLSGRFCPESTCRREATGTSLFFEGSLCCSFLTFVFINCINHVRGSRISNALKSQNRPRAWFADPVGLTERLGNRAAPPSK